MYMRAHAKTQGHNFDVGKRHEDMRLPFAHVRNWNVTT